MNDWTWILIPARQLLSVCGIGVMGLHPLHFDKRLARLVSKCKARDTDSQTTDRITEYGDYVESKRAALDAAHGGHGPNGNGNGSR